VTRLPGGRLIPTQAHHGGERFGSVFAGRFAPVWAQILAHALRSRVREKARQPQTMQQLTRAVFDRHDLVDWLSFGDGWLALITGSDFSRSNLVRSFLRETTDHAADR
jgi:hypothetical protein